MSNAHKGIWLPASPARLLMLANLHRARQVPSVSVSRRLSMPTVAHTRNTASPKPSWTSVFMRAYGLACQKNPELRRSWINWPYPHMYEHPHSVCALAVEREWQGEIIMVGSRFRGPENMSLETIDQRIHYLKTAPVEEVADFRRLLRVAHLPRLLQRAAAWGTLCLSGAHRSRQFGTFLMSSIGSLGTDALNPPCVLTTLLSPGPISPTGDVTVNLTFDHRITDGRPIARALNDLEEILNTTIVAELRQHRRLAA